MYRDAGEESRTMRATRRSRATTSVRPYSRCCTLVTLARQNLNTKQWRTAGHEQPLPRVKSEMVSHQCGRCAKEAAHSRPVDRGGGRRKEADPGNSGQRALASRIPRMPCQEATTAEDSRGLWLGVVKGGLGFTTGDRKAPKLCYEANEHQEFHTMELGNGNSNKLHIRQ